MLGVNLGATPFPGFRPADDSPEDVNSQRPTDTRHCLNCRGLRSEVKDRRQAMQHSAADTQIQLPYCKPQERRGLGYPDRSGSGNLPTAEPVIMRIVEERCLVARDAGPLLAELPQSALKLLIIESLLFPKTVVVLLGANKALVQKGLIPTAQQVDVGTHFGPLNIGIIHPRLTEGDSTRKKQASHRRNDEQRISHSHESPTLLEMSFNPTEESTRTLVRLRVRLAGKSSRCK